MAGSLFARSGGAHWLVEETGTVHSIRSRARQFRTLATTASSKKLVNTNSTFSGVARRLLRATIKFEDNKSPMTHCPSLTTNRRLSF
jgi:hypothetical protein